MSLAKVVPALAALLLTGRVVAALPGEAAANRSEFGNSVLSTPRSPRVIRTSLDAALGTPFLNARAPRLIHTSLDLDHPASHLVALPPRRLRSALDEGPSALQPAAKAAPSVAVAPTLDPSWLDQSTPAPIQFKRRIRTELSGELSVPAIRLPARRVRLTLD